ncbi:ATP-binding protein [Solirhodobacter olei]|uniref:ATP-binding protein n=1 Tax=Solirhodobacter olei TaxID=2493082 RepID=UPI000FDCD7DC|nr:ATP-binding protein [Solirhodobacter olei]
MRRVRLAFLMVAGLIILGSVLDLSLDQSYALKSIEIITRGGYAGLNALWLTHLSASWQSAMAILAVPIALLALSEAMTRNLWGLGKLSGVTRPFADPNLIDLGLLNKRGPAKTLLARLLDQLMRDPDEIERRLGLIIDNIGEGIITIDEQGYIGSFNPACERIFGWAAETVIGKNVNVLMPGAQARTHDAYLRRYATTGRKHFDWTGRIEHARRADGTEFPIELTVTQIHIAGRLVYVGILRDIADRKVAEKAKSEFLATVSHELRTPLTSIRGALGMLQADSVSEDPSKVKRLTAIALQNSERLGRLIDSILDMEKLEAGKLKLSREPLDLCNLVRDALEAYGGYGQQYGVTYEVTDHCRDVIVLGDRDRLMQVMANLLSNAVKFSPTGGVVRISGKFNLTSRRIRVEVSDDGCGIPDEAKATIFDKFTQVDTSDSRKHSGTGLGLAIARKIVEMHGGLIDFNSYSGAGTTFYFELPAESGPS